MPRVALPIQLDAQSRSTLDRFVHSSSTPQSLALRGRIVLAAACGEENVTIATATGVDVKTAGLWRRRFVEAGPESLWHVAPGRGRKPVYGPDKIKAIIEATLRTKPQGKTHTGVAATWRTRRG